MEKPTLRHKRFRAKSIIEALKRLYPDARCALNYSSPLELLVATLLSAQCTDVRVNLVTEHLFTKYPDVLAYAQADLSDLEKDIRSTGFYRNKAKSLIGCASALLIKHGGEVPQCLEDLVALPGVGRKTANVVLGNAFGVAGMVVDTHVKRIAFRLGWTEQTEPEKVERDLCLLLPQDQWTDAAHLLIFHGRALCKAPVPWCSRCPIEPQCPRCGVVRSK